MKRSARMPSKSGLPVQARPAGRDTASSESDAQVARCIKMVRAGIGGRRHCEELIAAGSVQIDNRTVTELGSEATPGQRAWSMARRSPTRAWFTTWSTSPWAGYRPTMTRPAAARNRSLTASQRAAVTVGRLDMSSEGLILVTNDGELANRLDQRFGVEKTYLVQVAGKPDREVVDSLRRGVTPGRGIGSGHASANQESHDAQFTAGNRVERGEKSRDTSHTGQSRSQGTATKGQLPSVPCGWHTFPSGDFRAGVARRIRPTCVGTDRVHSKRGAGRVPTPNLRWSRGFPGSAGVEKARQARTWHGAHPTRAA